MQQHLKWFIPAAALALLAVSALVFGIGAGTRATNGGCVSELAAAPRTFVVSAFSVEQDALFARVETQGECAVGGTTYYLARHEGEEIVIYMSGVGPREAAESTRSTLETFDVELLVFSGIAGAVDPELRVGQTVVARAWEDEGGAEPVTTAATLLEELPDTVTVAESGVTVDYFVTDVSTLRVDASIVDMETYAVARVAEQYEVPFIAFRSVSDLADGGESSEAFEQAAEASAEAALEFVVAHE